MFAKTYTQVTFIVRNNLDRTLITPFVRAFSLSLYAAARMKRQGLSAANSYVFNGGTEKEFGLEEVENLEALEDFINLNQKDGSAQGRGKKLEERTTDMLERKMKWQQMHLKNKILERKYFKKPHEVSLLTWKAKQQIHYLHKQFPDDWTAEQLAETFPISLDGVHRLLRSSFQLRTEEVEKHDKRALAHWRQLKKSLLEQKGPAADKINLYKHIIESGKLNLMINAGGCSRLPMPAAEKRKSHERRTVGTFEAIVAGSYPSNINTESEDRAERMRELESAGKKLLQEIAGSPKEKDIKHKHIPANCPDDQTIQRMKTESEERMERIRELESSLEKDY